MNLLFACIFFVASLLFTIAIILLRLFKNRRENAKKIYQDQIGDFINECLFNEEFDIEAEAERFRAEWLKTNLRRKIAIRQILIFNENLKGESEKQVKRLFYLLRLDQFVFEILKKSAWHQQSRALYVMSELKVLKPALVAPFLHSKIHGVREQAIYYFLKTSDSDPLRFFENLTVELTLWEQLYIQDSLQNVYQGKIPDFSQWLEHPLLSVRLFAIRMIREFSQFENIATLIPMLNHRDPLVRKETIKTLCRLNFEKLPSILLAQFQKEEENVKLEIINAIRSLGTLAMLQDLRSNIKEDENRIALKLLKAEKKLKLLTTE
ncbi:HEAT repeat domain-containing protein [Robertkochia solimangrovi]|uniref:HEAT repeat domain-containing protein n=1 Tax=Robertkochia solimangrovi TaxID=2213046 RepID=UPI00117DBC2D|nr:HEAT repeat domain-containing protein [Robertkochia solimangrovi]TRZ44338.1 hypothetical protein DMZ48_07450 [Robertkochia solimangrovi]